MLQLAYEAFALYSETLNTFIVKLIVGNDTVEGKIQNIMNPQNGIMDLSTLPDHYEGVGIHEICISRETYILDSVYYSG